MNTNTILFIGAESTAVNDLQTVLQEDETLKIERVSTRMQAITRLNISLPQMVVLCCGEAGVTDLVFCQEIRRLYTGLFIYLSDLNNSHFQVLALKIGVDVSFLGSSGAVLIAENIKSLLRRFIPFEIATLLTFGNLIIDVSRRDAFIDDIPVNLSTIEFDILRYLVQFPGRVVSRDEIHKKIYNTEYNGYDRNIDLYISRIRHKIGDSLHYPVFLKTVRGAGYQFIGAQRKKTPV